MKLKTILLWATLVAVGLLSSARAQRDAGSKARGDIYRFWSASSAQRHAQDHARSIYYYGQTQQPLSAPQVKEHATAIRQSLATTQKGLGELKKGNSKDKDVLSSIAQIETLHKKVLAHCDKLDAEIAKEKGAHPVVADCCSDMYEDLEAANAEMSKLMKALKIKDLPAPTKGDKKTESKK